MTRSTIIYILALPTLLLSCNKFIEVPVDPAKIERDKVFASEVGAVSAVAGIYKTINAEYFSSADLSAVGALASDEMVSYSHDLATLQFANNDILPNNNTNKYIWNSYYKILFHTNTVLKGLETTTAVSEELLKRLKGEVLVLRAFCHFYLVNLYGAIPVVTSDDYRINSLLSRAPIDSVYRRIVTDLKTAKELLPEDYPDVQRIRINRVVASALLARVYLYTGDWSNAAEEATTVISDNRFSLPSDLDVSFLIESPETIWHISSEKTSYNTIEGSYYVLTMNPRFNYSATNAISENLLNAFEPGDLRRTHWVGDYSEGSDTWYFPFKYKKHLNIGVGEPFTEYPVYLRLGEQYLIRSEARTKLGEFAGAAADLDSIRIRAGLSATTASDESSLLSAIEQERRVELFSEWSHRWLDLKRWKRADAVLAPIKGATWSVASDTLYPLPQDDYERNPNLRPQNPGY